MHSQRCTLESFVCDMRRQHTATTHLLCFCVCDGLWWMGGPHVDRWWLVQRLCWVMRVARCVMLAPRPSPRAAQGCEARCVGTTRLRGWVRLL